MGYTKIKALGLSALLAVSLSACDLFKSDEELCKDHISGEANSVNAQWFGKAYEAEKAGTPWVGVDIPENFKEVYDAVNN